MQAALFYQLELRFHPWFTLDSLNILFEKIPYKYAVVMRLIKMDP